jgi:hypothetical protein
MPLPESCSHYLAGLIVRFIPICFDFWTNYVGFYISQAREYPIEGVIVTLSHFTFFSHSQPYVQFNGLKVTLRTA